MEASGRVGGRMMTHYGDGWYADLGAMRYPAEHVLVNGVRSSDYNSNINAALWFVLFQIFFLRMS